MSGLALALIASGLWAALDAQRKGLASSIGPVVLVVYLTVGQGFAFGAWWAVVGAPWPSAGYWLPGLGVALTNLVASVGFVAAVRASPLSLTIPMLSLTPVLSSLAAWAMLGERPGLVPIVGIVAVVVGALTLQAGAVAGGPIAWARSLIAEPGARWMLGVAALWSVSGVLDKVGLGHAAVPPHGALQALLIGGALLAFLAVRGRLGELGRARTHPLGLLAAVLTSALAVGVQYLAILVWYVSFVEATKRAVGLVASVGIGRLFFGEPITAGKLVGVGVMTAGVLAIVLG